MSIRETSKPWGLARRIVPGILATVLAATSLGAHAAEDELGDPLERANRASHRISLFLDKAVFGPAARIYVRVTPSVVRIGITNFLDNLTYPNVILNDFLQGKIDQGLQDSVRFVVNTTFGLAGLIDFASGMGLERHDEDLGQTLAVWGVKEIAYLDLPGLGPNSVRDIGGIPLAWQTSLIALADISGLGIPVAILGAVNARANANEMIAFRDRVALDSYVFTREAYRRRRSHLISDGEAPEDDDDLYSARSHRQEYLLSLLDHPGRLGSDRGRFNRSPR
jgi:phospholipid-binding lipoprotein MlaA